MEEERGNGARIWVPGGWSKTLGGCPAAAQVGAWLPGLSETSSLPLDQVTMPSESSQPSFWVSAWRWTQPLTVLSAQVLWYTWTRTLEQSVHDRTWVWMDPHTELSHLPPSRPPVAWDWGIQHGRGHLWLLWIKTGPDTGCARLSMPFLWVKRSWHYVPIAGGHPRGLYHCPESWCQEEGGSLGPVHTVI